VDTEGVFEELAAADPWEVDDGRLKWLPGPVS
jgi:hypothetical protein